MADDEVRTRLDGEELLRCVPPTFVDKEYSMSEPSPRVFWPRADDDGQLSVDRENLRSAEESYKHRIEVLKLATAGVLAVSTDDVASVDLSAYAQPLVDNDAHAVVDFRPRLGDKSIREILLKRALERGWRFVP